MSIKIYRDNNSNAIYIQDSNGVQFLNTLNCFESNSKLSIKDTSKNINIVSNVDYFEFIDKDENAYGSNNQEVMDSLNSIFNNLGNDSYLGFATKPIRAAGSSPTPPFTTDSTTPVLVHTWNFSIEEEMALEFTVGIRYRFDQQNRDAVFRWDLDGVQGLSINQEPKDATNNSFTTLVDVENLSAGNHALEFYASRESGGQGSPTLEISSYLIVARRVKKFDLI